MKRLDALVVVAAMLLPEVGHSEPGDATAAATGIIVDASDCIGCHRQRRPGLVAQYESGEHARRGIGCAGCHGADHERIFGLEGRVPASRCADCHAEQTRDFRADAHSRAHADATSSTRFLAQSPVVRRLGCLGCHRIGPDPARPDDDGGRCSSCHGPHRFSAADARRPEACGTCHTGPEQPQSEAWQRSPHGAAFGAAGSTEMAPTCATCHMAGGTHDTGNGLTLGTIGAGSVLEGEPSPIPMPTAPAEEMATQRALMLAVCEGCHSLRTARRALDDADELKREADRLVARAVAIVEALHHDGLLEPTPAERRPHPLAGHALVVGEVALHDDHSTVEQLLYDLTRRAHATAFKGAYHQSWAHTYTHGILRMKKLLAALRSEDRRLRRAAAEADAEHTPPKP